MNTSPRSTRILVLAASAFLLFASILVPVPVYANPPDVDPYTEHPDPDCGTFWAGVVNNASSFTMKIKGNIFEGGPHEELNLAPGQNSESDTDMCDVDEVTVTHDIWYLWYYRSAGDWVKIRSWNIHCFNFHVPFNGNIVRCLATWMDPGDGSGPPPIDPPPSR